MAADLRQHLDPVSAAEREQRHLAEHPLLQVALREFADAAQTMLTRRHPMRNALHMVGTQRRSVRPMTTQHTSDRDRSRTDPAERVKSCGTGMHGGCPGSGEKLTDRGVASQQLSLGRCGTGIGRRAAP